MYEVTFLPGSRRQFLKLPKKTQERMKAAIERARIRPQAHFERLVGDASYKLRVGQYRIIADIYHDRLVVLVIEIGHRRNVYKRRR